MQQAQAAEMTFRATLSGLVIITMVIASTTADFTCTAEGVFPDPEDCHNFYMCDTTFYPLKGTCMEGNGTFDPVYQVCRVTPCSGPPAGVTTPKPKTFKCSAVGLFADPEDCHSFYSCDQYLNAIPGNCLKGEGSFDNVNKICTSAKCSNENPPSNRDFICISSGYYADPDDCHAFYSCNEQLVPIHSTCTSNGYFDPDSICVIGSCQDSTTNSPITESPGFTCPGVGYWPDPKNCRGFYVCNSNFVPVHGLCNGGGGYFDPDENGCYPGSCPSYLQ